MTRPTKDWRCDTCVYFEPAQNTAMKEGWCHIKAPVVISRHGYGQFPLVLAKYWCGQWTPGNDPGVRETLEEVEDPCPES